MGRAVATAIAVWLIGGAAGAETQITEGETLTVERCVEIAIIRHPDIAAASNQVRASRGRVGRARADYYPQLDLSSGYTRSLPAHAPSPVDNYSASVSLRQNIYDFGKTGTNVALQRLGRDSSEYDLSNAEEQVIFNVNQAYYGVLKAKRSKVVAEEAVARFEEHLKQAKGFYEVGTKPRFDVTRAEVDLSNAKVALINAANDLSIAVVALNNAMGVPDAPAYEIADTLSFERYEMSLEQAVDAALKNRPDLKSLIARKEAASLSVELGRKDYYPALSGSAAYNWSGESFPLEDGWSLGATLTFPIFSGFSTKYRVMEARADFDALSNNEESLRQSILLDAQQALLNLGAAEERIAATEIAVRQAEENLELAKGRYEAGVGSPIEVTDAVAAYTAARANNIQALYDYKIARATLERAMGVGRRR